MIRLLLFIFCLISSICKAQYNGVQPNVVLVLIDDLGDYSIDCDRIFFGGNLVGDIYAPYMRDSFDNWAVNYTRMNSTPVCTTSRLAILTGNYMSKAYHSFAHMEESSRTLAQELRWKGYTTGSWGKWQLNGRGTRTNPQFDGYNEYYDYDPSDTSTPFVFGYDHYLMNNFETAANRFSNCGNYYLNGNAACNLSEYGPQVMLENYLSWVEDQKNAHNPFFAFYNSQFTHNPYEPVPETGDYPLLVDDPDYFTDNLAYFDTVELKSIVDQIRLDPQLRQNTIIFVTADNGTQLNPDRIDTDCMGTIVEGEKVLSTYYATQVPMYVLYFGSKYNIPVGSQNNSLLQLEDIHATILDLAGVQDVNDGISFADDFVSYVPTQTNRDCVYGYYETFRNDIDGNANYPNNANAYLFDGTYWLDDLDRFYNISIDPTMNNPLNTSSLTGAELTAYNNLTAKFTNYDKVND